MARYSAPRLSELRRGYAAETDNVERPAARSSDVEEGSLFRRLGPAAPVVVVSREPGPGPGGPSGSTNGGPANTNAADDDSDGDDNGGGDDDDDGNKGENPAQNPILPSAGIPPGPLGGLLGGGPAGTPPSPPGPPGAPPATTTTSSSISTSTTPPPQQTTTSSQQEQTTSSKEEQTTTTASQQEQTTSSRQDTSSSFVTKTSSSTTALQTTPTASSSSSRSVESLSTIPFSASTAAGFDGASAVAPIVAPTSVDTYTASSSGASALPTGFLLQSQAGMQMAPAKIVGIVVGTGAAFIFFMAAVYLFFRWRKSRMPRFEIMDPPSPRLRSPFERFTLSRAGCHAAADTRERAGTKDPEAALPPLPEPSRGWEKSERVEQLPVLDFDRPKRASRTSIAQLLWLGPLRLNPVPEEAEKSSTKSRRSSVKAPPSAPSFSEMFFRSSKGSSAAEQGAKRASQVSELSSDAKTGVRQSVVSTEEESVVTSTRASVFVTPLSYPRMPRITHSFVQAQAQKAQIDIEEKERLAAGNLPIQSLRPGPEPASSFPQPPPSPSAQSMSRASLKSYSTKAEDSRKSTVSGSGQGSQ